MTQTIEVPVWLFILIVLLAGIAALTYFLLPFIRWFLRRRLKKAVARLNARLDRPIEPFKLARRYHMIQRLIYDPGVSREILNYAEEFDMPESLAFRKARTYAREIVPRFSAFAYFSFGVWITRVIAKSVYRVREADNNSATIASIPHDTTVIFIMNHRSNMDYLLVTYLASRSSALSYAVGEWARRWPLSAVIRSMGAYFIRRKSRGALYRKVLARYVQLATEGGVAQAMFPEGGLSLTGALQPPKMGLLSYVVDGFDPDQQRDVVFVPVAINYDRVLEDRVLIAAHKRGDRRFGAKISVVLGFMFKKLMQRLRGKDTRFGTAAVAFGTPVSLKDTLAGPTGSDVLALSEILMSRIEEAMPVLGVPLIATALLKEGPLTEDRMLTSVSGLIARLPTANLIVDTNILAEELTRSCRHLKEHGLIENGPEGWQIRDHHRDIVVFYANTIAHFLDGPQVIDAAPARDVSATAKS